MSNAKNEIDRAILLLVKAGYSVTRMPHAAATVASAASAPEAPATTITPPLLDIGLGAPKVAPHKCGVCGSEGHNARTCPKRPAQPATTAAATPPALDATALGFDLLPLPASTPTRPAAAPTTAKPQGKAPPPATSIAPLVLDLGGFDLVITAPPTSAAPAARPSPEASDTEIDALASELDGLDLPDSLL